MLRGKLRKTLAGALSLSMAFGTALSSVGVMPVLAEEALPDPALIPQPLEYEAGEGAYTLRRCARIVVQGKDAEDEQSLLNTADLLAARFRKSTGYDLPVVVNGNAAGDIILKTSDASPELEDEGYTLTTSPEGVVIEGYEPAGVYNGTQTLRQMFPAEIEKQEVAEGVKWVAKAAEITDKPEYSYRGMHLDVSRHFFTVEQVKRQIDLISQFKINKLHMHLSDDQGWRLEIKGEMYGESLDKLRTIGASTSCSTNGYKPGMYTQEDFKELVRYAAERNVEIIPEFDMPAHAWAALVSLEFLNSTEDGKPHAGNYDNTKPYDGWDVGWASLETKNEKTYEFIEEVVKQVSAISPSPIIHLGGDEAHSTARADYAEFMNRVIQIGAKYGKKVMGWQNMDQVLSEENKDDAIVQFWSTGNAKMMDGIDYILTPADHAYMDMKYDSDSEFGLTWATMNPVDDSYNWEPTNYGKREHILGVECALWTETIADDYGLDYMIYPRVAGHAEVGWTAPNSREWNEYKGRIGQYYDRFIYEGISLRRDEMIWPTPYVPVNSSFSFEEGEGTVVADNEGNWTGTISGNPSFVEGVKGKGMHFDGATCIDLDYGKDLQGAWTASMWVNREKTSGDNAVILSGKEGEIKIDQWKNTGKVGLTKFGVKDVSFNYSAPIGEWVYLTFVCDETKTDLYVNGQLTDSTSIVIRGPFSRIGHCAKSDMASTGFMNGSLDELAVYNEALTPEQVADLYAQFVPATKDDLNRLIEAAESLNEEDYTPESWADLETALEAARETAGKEDATAEEIEKAMDDLQAAMDALEKRTDIPVQPGTDTSRIKALLKEAMLYAETVMNSDDFAKLAPAVQTLLTMRYEEAEVVYNDADATFDEVAEAWKNLTDAIHMAAFYADKTDLKNKIDEADALDLSGYTEESAAALREALENAKAVYEDDTALQERIDQALADLIAAMAGLTEQPSNVDKSMLKMLLDEAGIAYGDPDSYVRDEAWNTFVAAYDAAQAVYDDETADADAVAAAVTSLGSAYLGIRHVPDEELVKALREFAALAETITRELYTEDVLEEIDAIVYEINTMLMADPFDNAYAAKFVEETVQPMADFIRETENSQKPATLDTPATGEPSVKPGTDKEPAEDVKKPAADAPVSEGKNPADAVSTDKAASTAKSVKTAAGLGAAGWMMAAAGAAAVAALNRSRKNR